MTKSTTTPFDTTDVDRTEAARTAPRSVPAAAELAGHVRAAATEHLHGPVQVSVDEQYTLTAVMLEHPSADGPRTLCVELLDHGPDTNPNTNPDDAVGAQPRWLVVAYDELLDRHTEPSAADTLDDALANLAWAQLDDDTERPNDAQRSDTSARPLRSVDGTRPEGPRHA